MATFINEQKMVEDNIFIYEKRINTPATRFIDKTPTPVDYYHQNIDESTVDGGFKDIEEYIGDDSPLKFNLIKDLPLYGLEQIQLALNSEEQGLDTSFEGDAFLLPGTIKPLTGDYFIIKHLGSGYLFRIIEIQYDNIRPDNFFKITYKLNSLDPSYKDKLEKQLTSKYNCILQNIGTENNCIIESEHNERLNNVKYLYKDMCSTYKTIFYNSRYNCFLGESEDEFKIFDPLLSTFVNKNYLFQDDYSYESLILSECFTDNKRPIKYEKSIYRCFERRDINLVNTFPYMTISAINVGDCIFNKWKDKSVLLIDIPLMNVESTGQMLPDSLVSSFKLNAPTESKYVKLLQKFIRKDSLTLYDIPLDLNEELLRLNANDEVFFFTPILLYIVKYIMDEFMRVKKEE